MQASPRRDRTWQDTLRRQWRLLQRLPLSMMLASLLLFLGSVQMVYQLGNNIYRTVVWRQETAQTQARVEKLQGELRILKDAEAAAADPAYLRTLARCYGYVGQGETVVVAKGAPDSPAEICDMQRLP